MIGRVAAVDYGRRRVGLAVCDPLGITVRGLPTFVRADGADAVAGVAAVLREARATRLVVGLPLHADGRPSEMSAEARAFGDALGRALGVPVAYVDEGLSSWAAEDDLRAGGGSLEKARKGGLVDQRVAMGLLRTWLDDLDRRPPPGLASADDEPLPPDDAPDGADGGDRAPDDDRPGD
ncbi:MAG: Holliday junction resolvase RuvX [Planctomycetota bacterium]